MSQCRGGAGASDTNWGEVACGFVEREHRARPRKASFRRLSGLEEAQAGFPFSRAVTGVLSLWQITCRHSSAGWISGEGKAIIYLRDVLLEPSSPVLSVVRNARP